MVGLWGYLLFVERTLNFPRKEVWPKFFLGEKREQGSPFHTFKRQALDVTAKAPANPRGLIASGYKCLYGFFRSFSGPIL